MLSVHRLEGLGFTVEGCKKGCHDKETLRSLRPKTHSLAFGRRAIVWPLVIS